MAGLIVALYQAGVFEREEKPAPQVSSTMASPEAARVPAPGEAAPTKLVSGARTAQSLAALPAEAEVKVGPLVYKILAAKLDRHSEDKLSLRFSMRMTNVEAHGPTIVSSDSFRLLVDDVPLAPKEPIFMAIYLQSAEEGDVVFVFPVTTKNVALQLGQVGGETTRISVNLKIAKP